MRICPAVFLFAVFSAHAGAAEAFRPAAMAYVLQADALGSRAAAVGILARCGRDLVVIDSLHGAAEGAWSKADIAAIRAGQTGRTVLAYLSIGEAEDYRPYWKSAWDADTDGTPDPGAPAFLCPANPDWPGNYRVRYWQAGWQALIRAQLDVILAQGFDGVYLDIVDSFEFFEQDGTQTIDHRPNPETGRTYRQDMVTWVLRIADYARAQRPAFRVIPQNGSQLLADAAYVRAIDAIGIEDLFSHDNARQPAGHVAYVTQCLKPAVAAGKPVLLIEYPTAAGLIADVAASARARGYTLLVTDRPLATLGAAPLSGLREPPAQPLNTIPARRPE